MKRILACLLIFVMIFAFAACNNDNEESKPSDESKVASTTPAESTDDTSKPAEESSKVVEESSDAPDDSSEPVEESSEVTPPAPTLKEAEEPANYIWLSNAEGDAADTAIGWRIDASAFEGKSDLRIFADVKFDDVVSIDGGLAFINIYFYDAADGLIDFKDWVDSRVVTADDMGKWFSFDWNFEISSIESEHDKTVAYATVSIGFWQATGKISVGPLNISAQKEMFWGKPFNNYLDLTESDIVTASKITDDTLGLNWDVVFQQQESVGTNLAGEDGVTVTLVNGEVSGTTDELKYDDSTPYHGSLNDGLCGAGELGDTSWFGFHPSKTLAANQSIDDVSGKMGTVVIDLGSAQEFNRVRAFHWSPKEWGISSLLAARAYYSDDGENWTEYGDLLVNSEDKTGWADTDVIAAATARYVKVDFLFESSGSWGMVGEVEVISAKQDIVE